jgi:SOS-response transcriptional repressor LexA
VLVAPGSICEDGILSLVKIDGQYTAKNLYIRGDKAILDSEVPGYKRREVLLKDLQIIGPVPYTCHKKAPKPFKK